MVHEILYFRIKTAMVEYEGKIYKMVVMDYIRTIITYIRGTPTIVHIGIII